MNAQLSLGGISLSRRAKKGTPHVRVNILKVARTFRTVAYINGKRAFNWINFVDENRFCSLIDKYDYLLMSVNNNTRSCARIITGDIYL